MAAATAAAFGCVFGTAGLANGTATRLLIFEAGFGTAGACVCDGACAGGAVAAAADGFESMGGGGPVGAGVLDISAGLDCA